MSISRRTVLVGGASAALAGLALRAAAIGSDDYRSEVVGYGPLVADPAGVFDLPRGFSYRIISRAGTRMNDGLLVPGDMDGMGCFDLGGGRVALVRNHELEPGEIGIGATGGLPELAARIDRARIFDHREDGEIMPGGTTTIIYDLQSGRVEREHLSLAGTAVNCAGGKTPWNSWLSCEETLETGRKPHGWVFEVPALGAGLADPRPLKAMGRFRHEAAAVDPRTGIVYMTEDREDGLFYRFLPERRGRLAAGGRLQALGFRDGTADARNWNERTMTERAWRDVRWIDLDDVESPEDDLRDRGHAAGAVRFARGEGMTFGAGELYFTCTSGGAGRLGQIMRYVPDDGGGRLQLFLESRDPALLDFPDNIVVAPWDHLILGEDQYSLSPYNHLRGITPGGLCYTIGRNVQAERSELAGVCFSPDGSTLFVNIYEPGLTLAIAGPWMRFNTSIAEA